jgi:hypothetical protein
VKLQAISQDEIANMASEDHLHDDTALVFSMIQQLIMLLQQQ